jgi:Trk K+ transport system NAD-binding subunit
MGVRFTIAVVQRSSYMHLLTHVGIDRAFSPRQVGVKEIELIIDESSLRHIATLAEGIIDVYRVRVGPASEVAGKRLREVKLSPNWILAAIQNPRGASVPRADDVIEGGDTLLVVGRHGRESMLRKLFATG